MPIFFRVLAVGIALLALTITVSAQKKAVAADPDEQSVVETALDLTGKATVIVVGTAAKAAWKTTKFTAVEVGKPAVKALLLKAAPKVTMFFVKLTGKGIQKGFPVVQKLAVTYLRTKVPI